MAGLLPETLQSDFAKYFDTVQPGQEVQIPGGGTVTRNQDGSATFSNGQYTYNYNKDTPIEEVANNVPALQAQWAQAYGSPAAQLPFNSFEEYQNWEAENLGGRPTPNKFNANYEAPDYIRQMGLAQGGGQEEAFNRYMFFKNNPQYAQDYADIHNGQVSKFATDGSTLVKTNPADLTDTATQYYTDNPYQLGIAEGFNMDPNMYAAQKTTGLGLPNTVNPTTFMQSYAMDRDGNVRQNNNFVTNAAKRSPLYNMAQFDRATGGIVDPSTGVIHNSRTGEVISGPDPMRGNITPELAQQFIQMMVQSGISEQTARAWLQARMGVA